MEDRKRERMLNREIQDSLLGSVMVERERGRQNRMKFLLKQSDVFRHFLPSAAPAELRAQEQDEQARLADRPE